MRPSDIHPMYFLSHLLATPLLIPPRSTSFPQHPLTSLPIFLFILNNPLGLVCVVYLPWIWNHQLEHGWPIEEIPIKKTDYPFPKSYQLLKDPKLGMAVIAWKWNPPLLLECRLVWSCAGLTLVNTAALSSWVHCSRCVQKMLFESIIH